MITKQKIKYLEESAESLMGEKIHYVMEKIDGDSYWYKGKSYSNLDKVRKDIDFRSDDILVIIADYLSGIHSD